MHSSGLADTRRRHVAEWDTSPPPAARNDYLDSLRGIAAMAVLVHHAVHGLDFSMADRVLLPPLAAVSSSQDLAGRALLSAANGGMAVYVFFVLSGCVLAASLERQGDVTLAGAAQFCFRRVLRIYPAVILAVVLFGLLSHLGVVSYRSEPFPAADIASNALLLTHDVIGATWTLQAELLLVPFILAVGWARARFGSLVLVGFLFWAQTALFLGVPFQGDLLNIALPACALGMLVPAGITRDAATAMPGWLPYLLLGAMVAVRFYFPLDDVRAVLLILALAFGVVALLYHARPGIGVFGRPALIFLGRISYSLYLLQVPVIYCLLFFYVPLVGEQASKEGYVVHGLVVALLATAITIPCAALSERYVERPFNQLGRNWRSRRRRATPG